MATFTEKVEQWGLLSWSARWLTFEDGCVRLYKSDPATKSGPAPYTFDLSDSATKVITDAKNDKRITLDNGSALIHVKFLTPEKRGEFLGMITAAPAAAAGAGKPTFVLDKSRYPQQLDKYWLGPINPLEEDPAGGFGSVKAGINSETGERVCCKMSTSEYEETEAQRLEIVMHAGLKHVNIVDLRDIVYEPPTGYARKGKVRMIMELCLGGELFAEVLDNGGLSEDKARDYFKQLLCGMAYCHSRDLVHRDIKLENLLLNEDRSVLKIADFGLAKDVSEGAAQTVIGTAKYVAPEMLEGVKYDGKKSDMWSCGVCLFCMTECRFPFVCAGNDGVGTHGMHHTNQKNLKLMKDLKAASYKLKPARTPEYADFLKGLLCVDTRERMSAADALKHPWILNGDDPAAVDVMIAEMGVGKVVVPAGVAPADWTAKVKDIMEKKLAEGEPEPEPMVEEDDDEEEGF